ncbi:hypothetical protein TNCV_4122901 [Trichonephila clavipes]|nr:hypothetical protein TNCV_4122901 [Trichonephila clavipes]
MVRNFGEVGERLAQVSSSLFDRGSTLRSPSPIALVFLYKATLVQLSLEDSWTATAGSDVVQTGRPIFDDFFQHLWTYIGNNTDNVVFQMVKRLWLIRIEQ